MDTMDAILTWRSIRKYNAQPVPEHLIQELLVAAMHAPSAGNQQSWHFVVITDRDTLNKVPSFHPHAHMLKEAPAAILVCADLNAETHKGYWVLDCAAATENLLLAAHALGLGAVWLGIHPREERVAGIKKLLNLPEHVMPLSLIALGYPAEEKPKADRYNAAKVHYNTW